MRPGTHEKIMVGVRGQYQGAPESRLLDLASCVWRIEMVGDAGAAALWRGGARRERREAGRDLGSCGAWFENDQVCAPVVRGDRSWDEAKAGRRRPIRRPRPAMFFASGAQSI